MEIGWPMKQPGNVNTLSRLNNKSPYNLLSVNVFVESPFHHLLSYFTLYSTLFLITSLNSCTWRRLIAYFETSIEIERVELIENFRRYLLQFHAYLKPFCTTGIQREAPKRFIFNWTIKFFHHILYEMLLCIRRSFLYIWRRLNWILIFFMITFRA